MSEIVARTRTRTPLLIEVQPVARTRTRMPVVPIDDSRKRLADAKLSMIPGGYQRFVRDETLTFEEFKLDLLCNVSETGYVYDLRELQSGWGCVEYQRQVRRDVLAGKNK